MRNKLIRALVPVLVAVALLAGLPAALAQEHTLTLTLTGCTAAVGETAVTSGTASTVAENAVITLTAQPITADPGDASKTLTFSGWEITPDGSSAPITLVSATKPETTFVMPAGDVTATVTAKYLATATLSGLSFASRDYNGAAIEPTVGESLIFNAGSSPTTVLLSDLSIYYTDSVGPSGGAAAYASATAPSHAGSYLAHVSYNNGTHAFHHSYLFTIDPVEIICSGITAVNRAYDGTAAVALNTAGATLSPVNPVSGESITLNTASASGTASKAFDEVTSGAEALPVTVSGLSLTVTGSSGEIVGGANNYKLLIPNVTVVIAPYMLTASDIALSGASGLTYNGTEQTVTVSKSASFTMAGADTIGFMVNDISDTTMIKNTFKATAAGSYTMKINALSENATGCFGLPAGGLEKTFTIAPFEVALAWDGADARTYNGAASNVTASVTNKPENGEAVTVTVTGGDATAAGSHNAEATALSSANYKLPGEKTCAYAIEKKTITLTSATVNNKAFDGSTNGTLSGAVFGGLVNSESLAEGTGYTANVTFSSANAATNANATVTVTLASGSNYTFMTAGDTTADPPIAPAPTASASVAAQANITRKDIGGTCTISLTTDANDDDAADTGDVLTVNVTGVTPADAQAGLTYQWKRGSTNIASATGASYTVTAADAGQTLSCTITGNGNYASTLTASLSAAKLGLGAMAFSSHRALGETLTATLTTTAAATDYTWEWYRGQTKLTDTGASHVIVADDLGKTLKACVVAAQASTAYSGRVELAANIPATAPAKPTADVAAATSQLSISWGAPHDHGSALTGYTLSITTGGAHIYGSPVAVTVDGAHTLTNAGGSVTYALTKTTGSDSAVSYNCTVKGLSGGKDYKITLTAANGINSTAGDAVTKLVKAPGGAAPAAPTRKSRTTSSITLTPHTGYEYSTDGKTWQDSNVFSSLKADRSYTFYQRVKATTTQDASATSAKLTSYTLASSSSNDDDDDYDYDDSSTTTTTTPKPATTTAPPAAEALYELTVSDTNTNILYSTMNKLIKGNETRDVTIRFPSVTYTFPKGSMRTQTGRVWYDLGVTLNACVHNSVISGLCSDAHVMTVHFNFEGALPGEANIRIFVGTNYAGQTLHYYKYIADSNTLTYMQTALVGADGWATVTQATCSDYCFTNADVLSATPTPAPTEAPTPAPTATPEQTLPVTQQAQKRGFDWALAAIITGAALVLLGLLWLLLKRRADSFDDDDDDDI